MLVQNIRNDIKETLQTMINTMKDFSQEMIKIVKDGKILEVENVELMFARNKKYTLTGKGLLPKGFNPQ